MIMSIILLSSGLMFSQSVKPVPKMVLNARSSGIEFSDQNLFKAIVKKDAVAERVVSDAQYLEISALATQRLLTEATPAIRLQLPYGTEVLELELIQARVCTEDFVISTSGEDPKNTTLTGKHFRGMIAGDASSLCAISVYEDDVMGFVSSERLGNLVLGKLQNPGNVSTYILYCDRNFKVALPAMKCETSTEGAPKPEPGKLSGQHEGDNPPHCLRSFIEMDYNHYLDKGSVQATVNYALGLYNQVATLYANESIYTYVSEVYVWITDDGYDYNNPYGSSGIVMGQFLNNRVFFNGDVANLLGLVSGVNLGGISAGIAGFCPPGTAKHTFTHIFDAYENVPVYSWSVFAFTHELGHILGSWHTDDCVWNGNNTAIDNCAPTSCGGSLPTNGGTIMSYCHLVPGVGINFNNGFGQQPGDVIRHVFNSATCLGLNCCGIDSYASPTCIDCASPVIGHISQADEDELLVNWTPNGATSYTVYYRLLGDADWIALPPQANPKFLAPTYGPVPCGTLIEVTVRANCATGSSVLSDAVIMQLSPCKFEQCLLPGPLNVSTTPYTATLSWAGPSIGVTYRVRYKLFNDPTWTTVFTANNTYTITGLTPSTRYYAQVNAICGNNISSLITRNFFTSPLPPCNPPTGLTVLPQSPTAAKVFWTGFYNAVTYTLRYRLQGSPTWTSINVGSSTSYNLTGLLANQLYEIQVQSNCTYSDSDFSSSTNFQMPSSLSNGIGGGATVIDSEIIAGDQLLIAPNPASGAINVRLWTAADRKFATVMSLMDIYGRILVTQSLEEGQFETKFDLSALEAGLYFVQVKGSDGTRLNGRIIKQ